MPTAELHEWLSGQLAAAGARGGPDRRQGPARLLVRPGLGAGDRRARRRPALAHRAAPPGRGGRLARHRLPLQPVRRPAAHQGDVQRRRLGARGPAHRAGRSRWQAVLRPLHRPARRLALGARARCSSSSSSTSTPTWPPPSERSTTTSTTSSSPRCASRSSPGTTSARPTGCATWPRRSGGCSASLTEAPQDADTLAALDRIHDDYVARYAEAVALTFDHTKAESTLAAREARDAQRGTLQQLRRDLDDARRAARPRRPPSAVARPPRSCAAPSYAASPAAEPLPRRSRLTGDRSRLSASCTA